MQDLNFIGLNDSKAKSLIILVLILSVGTATAIFATDFAIFENNEVTVQQAVVVNGTNDSVANINLDLPSENLVGSVENYERNWSVDVRTSSALQTTFVLSGDEPLKLREHFTSEPSKEDGFSLKLDSELLKEKSEDYYLNFTGGNDTVVLDNCCKGNITFNANFPVNYNVSTPISDSNMELRIDAENATLQ